MDLKKLPWTFISGLFEYLDSVEMIEFLKAVQQNDTSDLRQNNLFNILLDKRKFDLTSHHELKAKEFKHYVKFFDNSEKIVYFNIDYCIKLRWITISKFLWSLKAVTNLHMIGIEIKMKDLILILKEFKLTEISFSLYVNTEDEKLLADQFHTSASLVTIETHALVDQLFCLLHKFIYLRKLKIILNHEKYDYLNPDNKISFDNLEELIILGRPFDFQLKQSLLAFFFSLKYFLISIQVNIFNFVEGNVSETEESNKILNNLKLLFDFHKITYLAINLNDIERREGVRVVDVNFDKFLNHLNTNYLKSLSFYSHKKSFKIVKISNLKITSQFFNLTTLSIENIHIHRTSSFCESFSNLKSLKSLRLPCCALNIFKSRQAKEEKLSFKRIFDDDVHSTEQKIVKDEIPTQQLEFITRAELKLEDFSLYSMKDHGFDNYCYSIDYKEINEITKWHQLEKLSLNGFEIIGPKNNIKNAFIELSKLNKLNYFKVHYLKALFDFESQKCFAQNLKNFTNLKYFYLAFNQLHCAKDLFQNISEIRNLVELKLIFNFKVPNVTSLIINLTKLEKLKSFQFFMGQVESELNILKNNFKRNNVHLHVEKADLKYEDKLFSPDIFYRSSVVIGNKEILWYKDPITKNKTNFIL